MLLREPTRADWPRLLELNQASVNELSALDQARLELVLALAHHSLVVESDGEVVGFAIAMAPGVPYDSDNYRWFSKSFEEFLYLDRVAVAEAMRRRGIGDQLYGAMESAAQTFGRMVCEVNLVPRNEASLAFHASRGYREIGRLEHNPEKVVALMSKELFALERDIGGQ
ncbi:MAG TPA: GNAT family N-acetyltransferase [Solirubrobacteraceae bacterium]